MNKKTIGKATLASFLIAGTTAFSAFAAMPAGTVVIGNKAYDLAFANDPANLEEIQAAVAAGENKIFVKGFDGTWSANDASATALTAAEVTALPQVTYKSATVATTYSMSDGAEVTPTADLSATVSATGAKILTVKFNKAVDTTKAVVAVTKSGFAVNQSAAAVYSADKMTATITLSAKMTAGDYTVSLSGVSATPLTNTVTVKDETVTKITLPTVASIGTTDKFLNLTYKVYNQYNEDMTSVATSIVPTASKGVAGVTDYTNGVITIDNTTGNVAYAAGDVVTLSVLDPNSGAFVAGSLTVSNSPAVADISISQLYNADGDTLQVGGTASNFKLVIGAKDQYGNAVSTAASVKSDTIVTVSNPTVVTVAGGTSNPTFGTTTISGTSYVTLPLAGTLTEGTSTVTIISKSTGKMAKFDVTVKAAVKVDTLSLTQPTVAVNGEVINIPLTVVDQFGKPMTSAATISLSGSMLSPLTSGGNPLAISQDYVKNVAYAVLDLKAHPLTMAANTVQNVVITGVTGTGKIVQFTVPVRSAANPTVVVGTTSDFVPNLALTATSDLLPSYISVQDQYNRAITPDNTYLYKVTSSDASVLELKQGSTTGSALTVNATSASGITLEGLTKGSATVTIDAYNDTDHDGVADAAEYISGSTYSFNSKVVDKSQIVSYELADFAKLYGGASTDANHQVSVTVNGILADGTKVVVPQAGYYNVNVPDTNVSYTTKLTDNGTYNWTAANVTSRTVPVIVTVDGATTTSVLTKNVTVDKTAPAITTVALNTTSVTSTGYTLESAGVISYKASSFTSASSLANEVTTSKDQYGVTIANAFTNAYVTNHVDKSGNAVTAYAAGDTFNVTAITANGVTLQFKVILK